MVKWNKVKKKVMMTMIMNCCDALSKFADRAIIHTGEHATFTENNSQLLRRPRTVKFDVCLCFYFTHTGARPGVLSHKQATLYYLREA